MGDSAIRTSVAAALAQALAAAGHDDEALDFTEESERTASAGDIQPQVTWPGDDITLELEAPVIWFGTLTSHCCVHVGEPSVTPPQMDGRSRTQLFRYCVAMDIVGLPAPVA